ncbi:hypothetical protein [Streptosporangium sp. 'caverna']|uniref:hypothetical protein n=1 Tax=Streptosporangium sp. 'caverna' TaxID=2202249 RepID=UPI000D7E34DD|nr:hypothetical protein [Streptosporangium sp. 'caverna']AWS47813.1 hypothetical protein DKM19_47570 [Streptosporangium sp. 'caverna']
MSKTERPLVRELFPDLVADLIACLREEGEEDLAISAWDIRFYEECGCGDDFCQSFRTAERPDGAYGPGHRCVPLISPKGDLILDVVEGRIMFVEVLHYPKLPRPAD